MSKTNPEDEYCETIMMQHEDGSQEEYLILLKKEIAGKHYLALAPFDDEIDGDEYYLFGYLDHGNEQIEIIILEEDEEFLRVAAIFDQELNDELDDELSGEDD